MLTRDADPARDAAACAGIYAPYVSDTVISLEEVPPSPEEMRARIERASERYPWLIAEEDGEVAGYAYAGRHRERAAYRWASDVTVYLSPAHFRRGFGSALYTALFDLLVFQGVYVACAGVTLPNEASVGLHEALGFEQTGINREIGWKEGAWRDVGWFQLELAAPGEGPPPESR